MDGIFELMDFNGNGSIDYSEFLATIIDCYGYGMSKIEFMRKCFEVLDYGKDGFISLSDLNNLVIVDLQDSFGLLQPEEIIRQCDLNQDGRISFE
jgi:Ca2+-binding EF-hand superfamily protein